MLLADKAAGIGFGTIIRITKGGDTGGGVDGPLLVLGRDPQSGDLVRFAVMVLEGWHPERRLGKIVYVFTDDEIEIVERHRPDRWGTDAFLAMVEELRAAKATTP